MKISFLAIGDELTGGRVQDANGKYLADKLSLFGLDMKFMMMAGDNEEDMVQAFDFLAQTSDAIVISGGLGPTPDDLTIEVFARYSGRELVFDAATMERIKARFSMRGIEMPQTNRKQAMIPAGARIIDNPAGTAPGIEAEFKGRRWFFLPGVPREFRKMTNDAIMPRLSELSSQQKAVVSKTLRIYGIPESAIAERLQKINFDPVLKIAYLPEFPEISLRLSAGLPDKSRAEQIVSQAAELAKAQLSEYVFSDDDEPLELVVGKLLRANKMTLVTAESCTGGLVAKRITDIAGSSDYFLGGFIAYANQLKIKELEVNEQMLAQKSAVSEEVAVAMAKGARKRTGADLAISITGIAGPTGGTPEKPVGTVYMAVEDGKGVWKQKFQFVPWGREVVRSLTAETALEIIRRRILGLRMPGEKW